MEVFNSLIISSIKETASMSLAIWGDHIMLAQHEIRVYDNACEYMIWYLTFHKILQYLLLQLLHIHKHVPLYNNEAICKSCNELPFIFLMWWEHCHRCSILIIIFAMTRDIPCGQTRTTDGSPHSKAHHSDVRYGSVLVTRFFSLLRWN